MNRWALLSNPGSVDLLRQSVLRELDQMGPNGLRRLDYDIPTAQKKIMEAGLPQKLADRLALGK